MIENLTGHQVRIVSEATALFRRLIPGDGIIPMFRRDGYNLSVGLAYTENAHHYIVRETIKWYSSDAHIYYVCQRLVSALAHTYSTTRAHMKLFDEPHRECQGK